MEKEEYSTINEEASKSFFKKLVRDPMMSLGLIGLTSVVTYSLYNIRNRKDKPLPIYLIHMRLAAQGCVVGCLMVGLVYRIMKKSSIEFFGGGSQIGTADKSIVDQSSIGSK